MTYRTLTQKLQDGSLTWEQRYNQVGKMMKFLFPDEYKRNDQIMYNYDLEIMKLKKAIQKEHAYLSQHPVARADFKLTHFKDNPDPSRFFRADAQYVLTENENKLFQTTVGKVLRHNSGIHDALKASPCYFTGPYGAEIVEYYYYNDLEQAKFAHKHRSFDQDRLSISSGTQKTYGPSKGILLEGQTVASARRVGRPILEDHAREAALVIGIKNEYYLGLGTSHYLWPADEVIGGAAGMNGLLNGAGNDLGANGAGIGGDDNMTAAGDFVHTVAEMYSKEKEDKFSGKGMEIIVVCSPGVLTGLALNANATRGTTEWETVREYMKEASFQFKIVESHVIAEGAAAPTTTTQEMLMIVPDPRGIQFIETRPLGDRINLNTKNPEDVEFAVVGQEALVVIDSKALCKTATIITSTAW